MSGILSNIKNQVQRLILHPKDFWKDQKNEITSAGKLFFSYVFPLALVSAALVFIGEFYRSTHFYVVFAALKAMREILLFSLLFFLAVFFATEFMKTFGGEKNKVTAAKLVAYSMTPILLLSMITGLMQYFYFLDIAGLYGGYLFWLGGRELTELPEQKRDSYLFITLFVILVVFVLLSVILSKLITAFY